MLLFLSLKNAKATWVYTISFEREARKMPKNTKNDKKRHATQFGLHWWEEIWRPTVCKQSKFRVWSKHGLTKSRRVSWRQNIRFVIVWATITATGRSSLVFISSWVKIISQRYISDILNAQLLPWTQTHFNSAPWTLQKDSVPSQDSKETQI